MIKILKDALFDMALQLERVDKKLSRLLEKKSPYPQPFTPLCLTAVASDFEAHPRTDRALPPAPSQSIPNRLLGTTRKGQGSEMPRTQTKVGSYFHYWQEHVDKAMGYLSMKDHHRVAQAFMDIVECDLYTYDEDGKTTLKMEVDEDIQILVNMLVTLYAMEEVAFGIMLDLQNTFRYYNNVKLINK